MLRLDNIIHSEPFSTRRSLQGSLTRSIDTASTLPLSVGNGSQNNTLQRTSKSPDETDAINNLGLPVGGDGKCSEIYFCFFLTNFICVVIKKNKYAIGHNPYHHLPRIFPK